MASWLNYHSYRYFLFRSLLPYEYLIRSLQNYIRVVQTLRRGDKGNNKT